MKRLPARNPEAANMQDAASHAPGGTQDARWQPSMTPFGDPARAADATGVAGIVGYHGPYIDWGADAPSDSGGAALADLLVPAASLSASADLASLADPAAGSAVVSVTGVVLNDAQIPSTDLDAVPSAPNNFASLTEPASDSFAAFIANSAVTSLNGTQALDIDVDAGASSAAPQVLASLTNPAADSLKGFSVVATGAVAAPAPQGIVGYQPLHADPDAAAPASGGVAVTGGSSAAAAPASVPGDWASLANPPTDSLAAPIADSAIGSSGATAAQVQQALDDSGLNVNGSGIMVGVLSDSFNDLGGAAADEADGALPPAADIDVIKDLASGGTDEGRAMMQIIHDIAPGADLAFYTAFDSEQDFANGILALAAAGSKVIVDDVAYFDEPFFQNGVVAQAIQTVEAEGVTYVTAAGNDAGNAYQAAWTPISGTYDGKTLTDAESFGGSLVQTVTINTEGTGYDVPLLLEWNQAYGAAASDLEILVFNSSGRLVGTATNASSGESSNPWVEYDFTRSGTYHVAIENLSGPDPGLIKEITEGDGLPATISGANVGSVFGHAMTPGAIAAGAVSVADTPTFGVNPAVSESFSSSGAGTELLFANNGSALSSPDLVSPVAVSGVDDIHTTVPGGLSDFYGTSAASASLAGAAALILSADPSLTPAEVEQLMEETALPMANAAVSGAGLVQLDPAVEDAESGIFESGIAVAGSASDAIQGGAAIALLTGAPTISDFGQTNLTSVTISIANGSGNAVAGDELYVNGVQNGSLGNGITASWNATTDVLTLTGSATIAVYETLLGQVTYQDTGTDLSTVGHPLRTVTWTAFDGTTSFDTTSQVTIDRPPVANNDVASDVAGSTITATAATGVLSIDADLDGDKLTIIGVSNAASGAGSVGGSLAGFYGHLTLNADGSYSYVADNMPAINGAPAGSHPQDTFTYTVSDGDGGITTAELTIVIDRPPAANNDVASDVAGSTVTTIAAIGVLSIDTDLDGDKLTVTGVSAAASGAGSVGNPLAGVYGHLTLNADGSYSYVANNLAAIAGAPAGSHPQDVFTYTVSDGNGGITTAELTFAIDRSPAANNDVASDIAGSTITTTAATGVLSIDTDPDGDKLTVTGVSDAANGAGSVGNPLAGVYGHLTLNADGSYSYVANNLSAIAGAPAGSHPQDTFTYTVSDGDGGITTAELTIAIDRPPAANNDVASDVAGSTVTTIAATGVLSIDTDPDGDKLTVTGVSDAANGAGSVGNSLAGVYGDLTLNADGSYSYVANNLAVIAGAPAGSHPQDTFTYTVSDGNGGTTQAILTVALDRLPVVSVANVAFSVGETSVAASSLFTASDPDGDTIATYAFTDTGAGNFVLNGIAQANNHEIDVTAAQLSQLIYQDVPGATDTLEVRVNDGTLWSNWASFTVTSPAETVIQTDTNSFGTISLVELGNNYFLDGNSGSDPELSYAGAPVTVVEFGLWVLIGAERTTNGYEVAWKETGADQYQISTTDSSGNILTSTAPMSGSSVESYEPSFNQDINGDGTIGPTATVIEAFGSTSLVQSGNDYFLEPVGGSSGPELSYAGAPVTVGEFGSNWVLIGAEQTANGYEVAWKETISGDYQISTTDSGGNIVSSTALMSGSSVESYEPSFHQDLNGDGTIGPTATVIEADGTTSLVQSGNDYFLEPVGGSSGPELSYAGAPVTVGEFGSNWVLLGAEQTANGYEVAWKETNSGDFQVSTTDSSGNILSSTALMSPSSVESYELSFHQDLNGDGTIGPTATVIEADGSTSLVQSGNDYFLDPIGGSSGPELSYAGAPVTVGEFGSNWVLLGAEQTANGYEVAWKETTSGDYQVSTTDSSGNILSSTALMSANSSPLELYETSFHQDLNGDGYIGSSATVINVTGDVRLALSPIEQATAIDAGARLELAGADTGSVTFEDATGNLILDHSSEFSGQIFDFTGNGNLLGSDQIDLRDIEFGTGTTASYTGNIVGGTLSVTDVHNDTASISFSGDYTNSTFSISSDGDGGTLVVDPAVPQALAGGAFLFNESDSTGKYTVSVAPQDGGLGYVGSFTVDAGNTTNGQESVGWQFNVDPNSITQTMTQSYNVTVADAEPNGTNNTAVQSISVTIGGPGNDTFVFKPGLGADVIANATSSDTFELDGFSSVTGINQLQTLLTEAQTGQSQSLFESSNGGHDTVINLGNHDSITLANVQVADLHASNFIVHPPLIG